MRPHKITDGQKQRRDGHKKFKNTDNNNKRVIICYKCREPGHIATNCRNGNNEYSDNCFSCGLRGHRVQDCPTRPDEQRSSAVGASSRNARNTNSTSAGSNNDASGRHIRNKASGANETNSWRAAATTHALDLVPLKAPYMVIVNFMTDDGCGNVCKNSLSAMVDSGSPISIVKDSFVPNNLRSPINETISHFRGLNSSPLKVLGIFDSDVVIEGIPMILKFYIVPDDTMTFVAILGRDFTASELIKVELGNTLKIMKSNNENNTNLFDNINQILPIDYMDDPNHAIKKFNYHWRNWR